MEEEKRELIEELHGFLKDRKKLCRVDDNPEAGDVPVWFLGKAEEGNNKFNLGKVWGCEKEETEKRNCSVLFCFTIACGMRIII